MWRRSFLGLATIPVIASVDRRALAAESRPTRYAADVAALEASRLKLAKRHHDAKTAGKKRAALASAEARLLEAFDDVLFPAWRGTAWDFNGTTTVPRTGHIACGYFVTTLLRDAGVRVERAKLAQQASERIVVALCPAKSIWRFRKGDEEAVVEAIEKEGPGLYVVGLDNHVGYLRVAKKTRFWHASYVDPGVVTGEDPKTAVAFGSNYHIVGKLFTPSLLSRWLAGDAIPT